MADLCSASLESVVYEPFLPFDVPIVCSLIPMTLWLVGSTPVHDSACVGAMRRLSRYAYALKVVTARKGSKRHQWDAGMCRAWFVLMCWHAHAHLLRVQARVATTASGEDASALAFTAAVPVRCCRRACDAVMRPCGAVRDQRRRRW